MQDNQRNLGKKDALSNQVLRALYKTTFFVCLIVLPLQQTRFFLASSSNLVATEIEDMPKQIPTAIGQMNNLARKNVSTVHDNSDFDSHTRFNITVEKKRLNLKEDGPPIFNYSDFRSLNTSNAPSNTTIDNVNEYPYIPTLEEVLQSKRRFRSTLCLENKNRDDLAPLIDKGNVKQIVSTTLPNLTVAKSYAHVVTDASEITQTFWDQLPPAFLVKGTHLSGGIFMIQNKSAELGKCLKLPCARKRDGASSALDYSRKSCKRIIKKKMEKEVNYHKITPGCLFEEILDLSKGFRDYKIFMIHGKPMVIGIFGDRFGENRTSNNLRLPDDSWLEFPGETRHYSKLSDAEIGPRPAFLDQMLEDASRIYAAGQSILENPFTFVRLDFFVYGGNLTHPTKYAFAEMTFTPKACASGMIFRGRDAEHFYGFVGAYPNLTIPASSVFRFIEEKKYIGLD